MQKKITQEMYNYLGNGRLDGKTDKLLQDFINFYKDKFPSPKEQDELMYWLVEIDKNGFEMGVKSVCAFFSGKNDFN